MSEEKDIHVASDDEPIITRNVGGSLRVILELDEGRSFRIEHESSRQMGKSIASQ